MTTQGTLLSWFASEVPMWRLAAAILAVNVLGTALTLPLVRAAAPDAASVVAGYMWLAATASPLVAGAKAVLFTALAWSVAALVGAALDLGRTAAVFLAGELVRGMSLVFPGSVLLVRGADSLRSPADLEVLQGPGLFLDLPPGIGVVVDEHLGIFALGWIVVTATGLRRVAGSSRIVAVTSTAAVWLLGVSWSFLRLGFAR